MIEQEEQKILSYFKKYNLNLEDRPEFKIDKEALLKAAQKTIRLLESYTEEDLRTEVIQKLLESQL